MFVGHKPRSSFLAMCFLIGGMNSVVWAVDQYIVVPVRWCGVQGAPSMGGTDASNTAVLNSRLQTISDNIFVPKAKMIFRSGIMALEIIETAPPIYGNQNGICEPRQQFEPEKCVAVQFENLVDGMGNDDGKCDPGEPCQAAGTYPIIKDPSSNPGVAGDIRAPDQDPTEYNNVINKCRMVWDKAAPGYQGMVAIQIGQFRNADETVSLIRGAAPVIFPGDWNAQVSSQSLVVVDNSVPGLNHTKILAHELGHTLSLEHGDGIDDDGDYVGPFPFFTTPGACWQNLFPGPCSPGYICVDGNPALDNLDECPGDGMDCNTDPSNGPNLMQYDPNNIELTTEQINRLQLQAICLVPASYIDPGFTLPANGREDSQLARGDTTGRPFGDVSEDPLDPLISGYVDISNFGIFIDANDTFTSLFASTVGLFPIDHSGLHYYFAADLDNDSGTGGDPTTAGVPITMAGAEIIADLFVTVSGSVGTSAATVKRFDGANFVTIPVYDSGTRRLTLHFGGLPDPLEVNLNELINVTINNADRGPIGSIIRARAKSVSGAQMNDTGDRTLHLIRPQYPECEVNPADVLAGGSTVVTVYGLSPDATIDVFLGDQEIVLNPVPVTDEFGEVTFELPIPSDAVCGPRLLTVGVANTGLNTACGITVHGGDACPALSPASVGVLAIALIGAGTILLWTRRRSTRTAGT